MEGRLLKLSILNILLVKSEIWFRAQPLETGPSFLLRKNVDTVRQDFLPSRFKTEVKIWRVSPDNEIFHIFI